MTLRCETFDLKEILTKLTNEFGEITEIFIFGSRRHRTRSTRSDLDLLLQSRHAMIAEDIRDFAIHECPALDFFLIERGIATSCANGSKVRARSNRDLVNRLNALKIWDSVSGFTNADVDWEFEVIKGMEYAMTTLVSATPFPSKSIAVSTKAPDVSEASGATKWGKINEHPLVIIATCMAVAVAATFSVIYETRIVPLENQLAQLRGSSPAELKSNALLGSAKSGAEETSTKARIQGDQEVKSAAP